MLFKKKTILPSSYPKDFKEMDLTHIYFNAPDPSFQRENVISLSGIASLLVNESDYIPADFSQAKTVFLPYPIGSLLSESERLRKKKNVYHYHKLFDVHEGFLKELTTLTVMKSDGSYQIFINGKFCGSDTDSLRAEYDISKYIHPGANVLDITLFEDVKRDVIGISGPIFIDSTAKNRVSKVDISYSIKDEWLKFRIHSKDPKGIVKISTPNVKEYKAEIVDGVSEFVLSDTVLWTIDNPFFYLYTISLDSGECVRGMFALFDLKLGIKDEIRCLTLNDKPMPIKGIIDDYYYSASYTIPPRTEFVKLMLSEIKYVGFNAIRKTSFIDIPDYYHYTLQKGLFIAQDIYFNTGSELERKIDYLNRFESVFLLIIHLPKSANLKELFTYIKTNLTNKLVILKYKSHEYGDLGLKEGFMGLDKPKEEVTPFIASLKFEGGYDELKEFIKERYIPSFMSGMVGYFYSSLNNPKDGIYKDNLAGFKGKKKDFIEIIK